MRRIAATTALRLAQAAIIALAALRFCAPITFLGTADDDGWSWAVNTAAAHGLQFGRDVIFTYGPYASVITHAYNAALFGCTLACNALLAAAFASGLLALETTWPALLAALATWLVVSQDALAFALPLPVLLALARLTPGSRLGAPLAAALLMLAPALALLPLAKFSLAPLPLIATALAAALLTGAGRPRLAACFAAGTLAALLGFWCVAGQALAALPAYAASGLAIATGYNDAMSVPGSLATALLAAAAIILCAALAAFGLPQVKPRSTALLAAGIGAILAICSKSGLVRADPGHESAAFNGLGLAFLAIAGGLRPRPAALAAATGLALLAGPATLWQPANLPGVWRYETGAIREGTVLLASPSRRAAQDHAARAAVPPLPWAPAGRTDIYASALSRFFATGLAWAPRPVIESYSAYTPGLARLNAAHLRGPAAPDAIFFRPDPIDFRLPALEDGPSWPLLLSRYAPAAYDPAADMLLLRRTAAPEATPGAPILTARPHIGERVPLPASPSPLWATLDIEPSALGRAASLLWHAPVLTLTLSFADAPPVQYRVVPGMARAGFLLSPLTTTTLDFLALRAPPGAVAAQRRTPVSLNVAPAEWGFWAWRRRYRLTLSPISFPPLPGPVRFPATMTPQRLATPTQAPPPEARCVIDALNGRVPTAGPEPAPWLAQFSGWALADPHRMPEKGPVALVFTAADGTNAAIPVLPVPRTDVAAAYHFPLEAPTGFAAAALTQTLPPGRYDVGILLSGGLLCRPGVALTVP